MIIEIQLKYQVNKLMLVDNRDTIEVSSEQVNARQVDNRDTIEESSEQANASW